MAPVPSALRLAVRLLGGASAAPTCTLASPVAPLVARAMTVKRRFVGCATVTFPVAVIVSVVWPRRLQVTPAGPENWTAPPGFADANVGVIVGGARLAGMASVRE